jgi:hypothetical protein
MRRCLAAVGVWLGVFAVAVNATVPIHLTQDLVHAVAHGKSHALAAAEPQSQPTHHPHDPAAPAGHDHGDCLICGAHAALAAVTAPTPATLALPAPAAVSGPAAAVVALHGDDFRLPYAPRAPPRAA